ncbi:MAG: transcription/translation regulatory transformer protein RfaH [Ferrovum sp.]|nr:transcription/translation regulatory transformer protein RfaH [Ferrovum sp.]
MSWYLLHTRPRQEKVAHQNLLQQGYENVLPLLTTEKVHRGRMVIIEEPLFPRYLFVRLGQDLSGKSWAPLRSTRGVSRLVTFGNQPAHVEDTMVEALQARSALQQQHPQRLFSPGDAVAIDAGPFKGLEAIYQMTDGEHRALVLIELLCKPTTLRISPVHLSRTSVL